MDGKLLFIKKYKYLGHSVDIKIFHHFEKGWRVYLGAKNVIFCLKNLYTIVALLFLWSSMKHYFPVLTRNNIDWVFLGLFGYSSFTLFILLAEFIAWILASTGFYLFNFYPLIIVAPWAELYIGDLRWLKLYLVEGWEVEIIFKLHIDIMSVLWIFWIWKAMRGYENSLHEIFGNALKGHVFMNLYEFVKIFTLI